MIHHVATELVFLSSDNFFIIIESNVCYLIWLSAGNGLTTLIFSSGSEALLTSTNP